MSGEGLFSNDPFLAEGIAASAEHADEIMTRLRDQNPGLDEVFLAIFADLEIVANGYATATVLRQADYIVISAFLDL